MKTTTDYLNDVKQRLGVETDYKLADWLGIHNGTITNWRSGKTKLDNFSAARLAKVLEIDPMEVIATNEAEREKDEARKAFWKTLAQGTKRAFGGVALLLGSWPYVAENAGDWLSRIMGSRLNAKVTRI